LTRRRSGPYHKSGTAVLPGVFSLSVFESLRARLDRLFAEPAPDPRARAERLRDALAEASVGLARMRDGLAATEQELAAERQQLDDTERRGRLAAQVSDMETVAIAERFAVRHRERVAVLARKLVVQRDELGLARREIEEMTIEVRAAVRPDTDASLRAAWRELEAAGGARPGIDLEGELERARADRERMERAVEAQLAQLKKRLGRGEK
jgi:SpoVK/Ycf46/Vps4 family AAA+-type ATPase